MWNEGGTESVFLFWPKLIQIEKVINLVAGSSTAHISRLTLAFLFTECTNLSSEGFKTSLIFIFDLILPAHALKKSFHCNSSADTVSSHFKSDLSVINWEQAANFHQSVTHDSQITQPDKQAC